MSKYLDPRPSRKLRKVARTLPVKGKDEDEGRYFRCWNCGFVCDTQRDSLGGPRETNNGVIFSENIVKNNIGYQFDDDPRSAIMTIQGLWQFNQGVMLAQSDGTPREIKHDFKVRQGSGCPGCGTLNWRGDYP